MVGRRMLALIDSRLRLAFPELQNQPFGGRSVTLVGDFGQLPPVLRRNSLSNDGMKVYSLFREVYQLDIICSQSGHSIEQRQFRDILMRLRDGDSTLDDWRTLKSCFKGTLSDDSQFSDAICITPRRIDVDEINYDKLRSLNVPVARIRAIHTGGSEASKADSDLAKGLESQLLLARGARVMLRANLCVKLGLVNSSIGTVDTILFEENQGPPSLPIAVLVEFDNYTGPAITSTEGKRVVPVTPIRRTWETNTVTCSRLQLPLCLTWAITVHKSRGLTLPKAFIDLGPKEYALAIGSFICCNILCKWLCWCP